MIISAIVMSELPNLGHMITFTSRSESRDQIKFLWWRHRQKLLAHDLNI